MFNEASAYAKTKFAEYELKKFLIPTSFTKQTVLEQRRRRRNTLRRSPSAKIFWATIFIISGCFNGLPAIAPAQWKIFAGFCRVKKTGSEKAQTARSVIVIVSAQNEDFAEAEKSSRRIS